MTGRKDNMTDRRDSQGRLLISGEDQLQSGRYRYRYKDYDGQRRAVYSWRLKPGDPVRPGKKKTASLRELEQYVEESLLMPDGQYIRYPTLDLMFTRYLENKPELKPTTRENYIYLYEGYIAPNLGEKKVDSIRYSDLRSFYIRMVTSGVTMRDRRTGRLCKSKPFNVSSMGMIHGIIHPVLQLAVRDGYIQKNPAAGLLAEIRRAMHQTKPHRRAFSEIQQIRFIEYLISSRRYRSWLPLITVFLGTGCRVGELIGLRWEDCDFDNDLISVNHSLVYRKLGESKCRMHVSTPKTISGVRTIPMLSEVRRTLLNEKERQEKTGGCLSVIDGYEGFVFMNRRKAVHNPSDLNRALERMRNDYNKEEEAAARLENREAVLLPHFSAHNLRHTFCTRFCENETNIKMIQDIMGHADISTTMNIYAEATEEKKRQTMKNLEGKIRIC
ncbi:MAG: tyrosine-type recombinase/integrase [Stomatobaculum sp.]|nr:tyrosine-type recombinase/integrase [Stomatobaculum sp.]